MSPNSHHPGFAARLFPFAAALSLAGAARAQQVSAKTNYYTVTGESFREIHESIRRNRPWKQDFDGYTTWQVKWSFNIVSSPDGCRCTESTTSVAITTTLPRWVPSTNATPGLKERWRTYYLGLAEHEHGHAAIAIAAAAEVQRELSAVTEDTTCSGLRQRVNAAAEAVVSQHRDREKTYDQNTAHGMRPARQGPRQ